MTNFWNVTLSFWNSMVATGVELSFVYWFATAIFILLVILVFVRLESRREKMKTRTGLGFIYIIGGKRSIRVKKR